jgi:dihydropyrimidinase
MLLVFDLIVRGGLVVTPGVVAPLDLAVSDGVIAAVTQPGEITTEGARVIDAQGLIVLPGGIEPHAHIAQRVQASWAGGPDVYTQSPEAASRAAAFGGVTTIIDFASAQRGAGGALGPIMEGLEERRDVFADHTYTDFAFHFTLTREVPPDTIAQIPEAVQAGVASFKIFTTTNARVPYGHLSAIMDEVAGAGGIMAIHAEEDQLVTFMREKLIREGRDQGYNLPLVHSNLSEDLAFRTVIRLAKRSGAGVYFVHTTAKEGVEAIAEARADGLPVYGEALHNYMHFTAEDYRKPDGTAIHTYPAIKSADDRDALIAGLMDGRISTTATDEYTTHRDVKLSGDTIETVCGGHNGIETRIPVAFTKLVQERGMALDRFADCVSTNAAKILGLYPRKGAILPGSDADLAIIDPALEKTLTLDDLHADSDYSIWEGFACRGYPITTVLRGKVIVEGGQLLGTPADGKWLERSVAPEVLSGPAV